MSAVELGGLGEFGGMGSRKKWGDLTKMLSEARWVMDTGILATIYTRAENKSEHTENLRLLI